MSCSLFYISVVVLSPSVFVIFLYLSRPSIPSQTKAHKYCWYFVLLFFVTACMLSLYSWHVMERLCWHRITNKTRMTLNDMHSCWLYFLILMLRDFVSCFNLILMLMLMLMLSFLNSSCHVFLSLRLSYRSVYSKMHTIFVYLFVCIWWWHWILFFRFKMSSSITHERESTGLISRMKMPGSSVLRVSSLFTF